MLIMIEFIFDLSVTSMTLICTQSANFLVNSIYLTIFDIIAPKCIPVQYIYFTNSSGDFKK